ncbi:unnamed protein product, partial [Ectocarpus sp. 12 AP-2014]
LSSPYTIASRTMGKQPTTFRIKGAATAVSHLGVESFFDNFGVPLSHAFAATGIPESTTILINLKNKATLAFVEKTLKRDFGSQYTAEAVETVKGQRFVPGERQKKIRCKATIEVEAAAAAAASHLGDSTAIFFLVGVSQRATYSYNTQTGLVREGREPRTGPLVNGNLVPAGGQAGVASGLVVPRDQVIPLSEKLPTEFSSDVHGRALNGQVGGGGGGGGGGGEGDGDGNNGGYEPIGDRPDESLPPQSFPDGALGGQGVNGMIVEDGGWEGELPPCIDSRVGFGDLPDGSIGDGDEGKDGGGKARWSLQRASCPPSLTTRHRMHTAVLPLSRVVESGVSSTPHMLHSALGAAIICGRCPPGAARVLSTGEGISIGEDPRPRLEASPNPIPFIQFSNFVCMPLSRERPENRQERRPQIPVGSLSSIMSSIGSSTSYHEFFKRCGSPSSFGPESERLLKVAVHEALELEMRNSLCDTASTPLQSVPDLASVMNSDWDKTRAERDGKEPRQIQKTTAGGEFPARTYYFSHPHADGRAFLSFVDQGGRIVLETDRLSPRVHLDPIAAGRRMLPTGRDPSIHVPKLVGFVQNEDEPDLQLESVKLLATICGSHAEVVVKNGAVPIFVRLLTSANDDIREEVVRAVGNIAGDSPVSRDLVLQLGALDPLLQQLTDRSKLSVLRIATWALSKVCGEISPARLKQVGPALPTLTRLIRSVDEGVLRNACAALRYLCTPGLTDFGAHREMVQAVVGTGVCQRLVELLYHGSPAVHLEVLWAMNGIVSSENQHTQELINSNVLPGLHHLVTSSHHQKLREMTCQVICRITTGREEQIQAVIEAGIIPTLIQFLADVNSDIQRYASSTISNVMELSKPEKVKEWIPLLLSLLENDHDTQDILTMLEILEKFLKVVPDSDAWQPFRSLLNSPNSVVCGRACRAIYSITWGNKKQYRVMIEAGIVPVLIELLPNWNYNIQQLAASVISNVTEEVEPAEVKGWIPLLSSLLESGNTQVPKILEIFLKVVPDSDAWRQLRHLLSSSDTRVSDETCDVIFRVTEGNKEQSRAAIEAGIVPVLIQCAAPIFSMQGANACISWLSSSPPPQRAASAISNATKFGEPEDVRRWIPRLRSLLENSTSADVTIMKVLQILQSILERGDTDAKAQGQETNQMATCMAECGGWKRLEHLDRFGPAVPVGGILGINPKVRRSLTRLFVYAKYLMFN